MTVYRHGKSTGTTETVHPTAEKYGTWSTNTFYGAIDTGGISIKGTVYNSYGTVLVTKTTACTTNA